MIFRTKDLFMSQKEIKRSLVNFYLIRGLCYWSGDRVSKKDRKDQFTSNEKSSVICMLSIHLKSRPFATQPLFTHLKSLLYSDAGYSDPHCIQMLGIHCVLSTSTCPHLENPKKICPASMADCGMASFRQKASRPRSKNMTTILKVGMFYC